MTTKTITVFTPTYNRAHTLNRLYESLSRQTSMDFVWCIIDDGSSDNTKEVIETYIQSADFEIRYAYKDNGGKHTAINLMIDMLDTELVVIVDSDDYLSDDAIETILEDFRIINDKSNVGAILYLRLDFDGRVIGDCFEEDYSIESSVKPLVNRGIKGDKCDVFLSYAIKNYRFPFFENENFVGETVVWIPLFSKYKSLHRNKGLYYCEYQEDGLTKAGRAMRINNPLGGMENSKAHIRDGIIFRILIKNTLLYVVYGKFAKKKYNQMKNDFPQRKLLMCLYPVGLILYIAWKRKYSTY